jgi:hypothetical protein
MPDSPPLDDAVSFATIGEYPSLEEALLVRGLLASYEITAFLSDENFLRLYGGSVHSHGGIPLRVHQRDAEVAREILRENQQLPNQKPCETTESDEP